MVEYIEREAALKAIAEDKIEMTPELIAIGIAIGTYTAEQAFDGINQACDRHIESIKIIPAADVQPVKHGEWLEREQVSDIQIDEWQSCRCSVCKKYHTTPFLYYFNNYNYCPNCGTKMDGEDDG